MLGGGEDVTDTSRKLQPLTGRLYGSRWRSCMEANASMAISAEQIHGISWFTTNRANASEIPL